MKNIEKNSYHGNTIYKRSYYRLCHSGSCGAIGVLCIQRSLHDGFKIGLMTGLGAALADGTYALIAGFGLSALSSLLIAYQFWTHSLVDCFCYT
jgi:hypothetical protein